MPAILVISWIPEGILWYWVLLFSIVIGLVIGSFLNVCIDRLPLQSLSPTRKEQILSDPLISGIIKQYIVSNQISIAVPARSVCFACGHRLRWYENIPVVSYLWGRGRCRHCDFKYGLRSFWIELLNGMVYGMLTCALGISPLSVSLALTASTSMVYAGILKEEGRISPGVRRVTRITAIFSMIMILARLLLPA